MMTTSATAMTMSTLAASSATAERDGVRRMSDDEYVVAHGGYRRRGSELAVLSWPS